MHINKKTLFKVKGLVAISVTLSIGVYLSEITNYQYIFAEDLAKTLSQMF